MRCGLPQGSLLGPLLFNIFINDVNYCVATSSLRLYADDTTQYSSSVCPMTLEFNLNADISRLKEWFTYNYQQLGINSTKTQAMVLGNSSYNFEFFVDPQQVIENYAEKGICKNRRSPQNKASYTFLYYDLFV